MTMPRQPGGEGQENLGGGDRVAERMVGTVHRQAQLGGQPLEVRLTAGVRSAEVGGSRHGCGVNDLAAQPFSVCLEGPGEE